MTVPDQSLDPHLEEVLRDIEGDPRARMFQASPRQLVTVLTDRSPRLSSRQAGLTSAERELLTVHREDLAYLLYSAARSALVEKEDARTPVGRWFTPDLKLELLPRSRWLERALFCRSAYPPALLPDPGYSLLGEQVANDRSTPLSCCAMALAALRLVPSTAARIVLAYALEENGQEESSLKILTDVLGGYCSSTLRITALVNLSGLHTRQGQHTSAVGELDLASALPGDRLTPAMNILCLHLRVGNERGAMNAADRLHSLADPHHPGIAAFVQRRRSRLHFPFERPTPECLFLIPKLRDRLSPTARRIADVYWA